MVRRGLGIGHPNLWRCGAGRALYVSLFEILRRQGYVNAYAGITLPNESSIGLHESLGFTQVGVFNRIGYKLGRWHDIAWLHLRLLDAPAPVSNPALAKDVFNESGIASFLQKQADAVRCGV